MYIQMPIYMRELHVNQIGDIRHSAVRAVALIQKITYREPEFLAVSPEIRHAPRE